MNELNNNNLQINNDNYLYLKNIVDKCNNKYQKKHINYYIIKNNLFILLTNLTIKLDINTNISNIYINNINTLNKNFTNINNLINYLQKYYNGKTLKELQKIIYSNTKYIGGLFDIFTESNSNSNSIKEFNITITDLNKQSQLGTIKTLPRTKIRTVNKITSKGGTSTTLTNMDIKNIKNYNIDSYKNFENDKYIKEYEDITKILLENSKKQKEDNMIYNTENNEKQVNYENILKEMVELDENTYNEIKEDLIKDINYKNNFNINKNKNTNKFEKLNTFFKEQKIIYKNAVNILNKSENKNIYLENKFNEPIKETIDKYQDNLENNLLKKLKKENKSDNALIFKLVIEDNKNLIKEKKEVISKITQDLNKINLEEIKQKKNIIKTDLQQKQNSIIEIIIDDNLDKLYEQPMRYKYFENLIKNIYNPEISNTTELKNILNEIKILDTSTTEQFIEILDNIIEEFNKIKDEYNNKENNLNDKYIELYKNELETFKLEQENIILKDIQKKNIGKTTWDETTKTVGSTITSTSKMKQDINLKITYNEWENRLKQNLDNNTKNLDLRNQNKLNENELKLIKISEEKLAKIFNTFLGFISNNSIFGQQKESVQELERQKNMIFIDIKDKIIESDTQQYMKLKNLSINDKEKYNTMKNKLSKKEIDKSELQKIINVEKILDMEKYIKLIHEQEKKAINILYQVFHGKFSWLPDYFNFGQSKKNKEIQKAIDESKKWSLNIEKLPYGFEVINKKAQAEKEKKEK